jgi:hypothetical protein
MPSFALGGLGIDDDEGPYTSIATDGFADFIPDALSETKGLDARSLSVVFQVRPVTKEALDPTKYVITPPIKVHSVKYVTDYFFILITDRMTDGVSYTLDASLVSTSQ